MTLSERARQFLDTAFELALTDEFMGEPTAGERQNIEAIRSEIDELQKRLAEVGNYVPLPDGVYRDSAGVRGVLVAGDMLRTFYDYDEGVEVQLQSNARLCRRATPTTQGTE